MKLPDSCLHLLSMECFLPMRHSVSPYLGKTNMNMDGFHKDNISHISFCLL